MPLETIIFNAEIRVGILWLGPLMGGLSLTFIGLSVLVCWGAWFRSEAVRCVPAGHAQYRPERLGIHKNVYLRLSLIHI